MMTRSLRNGARAGLPAIILAALALAGCSSSSSSSAPSSPASSAAGTAGSTGSTGSTPAGAAIKIGAVGSFTGVASGSTAEAKTLAQDWASATNASGGINGHPVQITFLDDLNTPSTALANVQQLVNQDHVQAIFDLSEDQESTWAKVADAAKVPVIGQSEGPTFGADPNFYSVGTTVGPLIWGELKAASLGKVSKIGALYCAEIASCSETVPLITQIGKPLNIALAYSAKVSSSAASYTAQCLGAKGAGANGATVVAASNTALNVAASCATQGYKPVWVTTAGEMTTPWLKQSAVNGAIGNVQDVPWFDNSIPATKAMQAAIAKYSPDVTTSAAFGATASIGWASGLVFAYAAQQEHLTPASPSTAVITGLDTVKNNTFGCFTPPITYTAGKAAQVPCSFVAGISNGNWTEPIGLKTICQPAA
jgi:branched-chain amino acid transport system substrate-binding protein